MHWFPRHCENMDSFRAAVKEGLTKASSAPELSVGNGKKYYTVQVGAFASKENAETMLKKLKEAGFEGFIKYN